MWQSVVNYLRNLRAYPDLSPDIGIRRRINAQLRKRSSLSLEDWTRLFTHPPSAVSKQLLTFIYTKLSDYSGLDVGRLRPSDRLIEDLQIPLVCWFDWPNQLCADFYETFQIDITEEFDESLLETVEDLVCFLNQRLQSIDSIPSG
ncbi:hypothetical protein PN498_20455 [Oscillatoria sp. CS-180]|uniref:hypothetical protein n=1 Tax=Oscillatoria sp. CS-180 TaxID=3021720 RepID=UPI00232ADAFC|nr:hypothetical protein [Oscillatoria sp. CS-180]MDB9528375.1 hypothetical protein [Oscillatoria sp. CS-180]